MKTSVEPLEGNKVKLSVEVDEQEFDKAIDAAFKKLSKEVRIPGFRPGKAPRRVLEARIGIGPAREQALREAIPRYLGKAVREHDVDLVATPQIEVTGGQEEGIVEFEAECEVRPEVTIPGYGGLRVELDAVEPTAAEARRRACSSVRSHADARHHRLGFVRSSKTESFAGGRNLTAAEAAGDQGFVSGAGDL